MSGLFVAIVGPSGAGKDALIRALAARFSEDADFVAVRRVVTRAADAHEDHHSLDLDSFEDSARADHFALTWEAHGLRYGVPNQVDEALAAGKTLVCNLSRGAVAAARRRWPNVLAVLVTARAETRAQRLAARGRERPEDQLGRISRTADAGFEPDTVIENDGELAEAVDRLFALVAQRATLPA